MQLRWLVAVTAVIGFISMDPALARPRKAKPVCVDPPQTFSLGKLIFGTKPQPNGCSPAVYQYGQFIGQDPDPNIRAYMLKDPSTGYSPL